MAIIRAQIYKIEPSIGLSIQSNCMIILLASQRYYNPQVVAQPWGDGLLHSIYTNSSTMA